MGIRIIDYVLCDASGNYMYKVKIPPLKAQVVSATELISYYDDKYTIAKFNGNILWLIER